MYSFYNVRIRNLHDMYIFNASIEEVFTEYYSFMSIVYITGDNDRFEIITTAKAPTLQRMTEKKINLNPEKIKEYRTNSYDEELKPNKDHTGCHHHHSAPPQTKGPPYLYKRHRYLRNTIYRTDNRLASMLNTLRSTRFTQDVNKQFLVLYTTQRNTNQRESTGFTSIPRRNHHHVRNWVASLCIRDEPSSFRLHQFSYYFKFWLDSHCILVCIISTITPIHCVKKKLGINFPIMDILDSYWYHIFFHTPHKKKFSFFFFSVEAATATPNIMFGITI
ncbi:hypothetical protein BD770DRAFT_414271 [Pilaira anomala]|nr:hypothetical protein BD770DRAFT_414271 [Pilaira anomala]